MEHELIMAKQTTYDSMFGGDKWYQHQARKAFPILVQRAKARKTITYKELGETLGLNKYFVPLGTVFSSISTTLAALQARWSGGDIPLITNLVTKENGHPNQFVCAQLTGDPKKLPTQEKYDAVLKSIFDYQNWDAILKEFSLEKGLIMETQESDKMKSLSDFIDRIVKLESESYLFRGVSNKEYEIAQASAYRRLDKGEEPTLAKLIEINKSTIEKARRRGYDLKEGRTLSDLEILCEMQHFRIATCLIDFTYSAEVALWFACGSNSDKHGKVVAVLNDHNIKEVTSEMLERKIDDFFKEDEMDGYPLYQWQPIHLNNRVIRQHSVFLFGGGEIRSPMEFIIDADYKEDIRRELKRFSNISEDTLFPDFEGFSRLHAHNVPYAIPNYSEIADEAYQRDDYPKAIANYKEAIRLDPDDEWLFYMKGKAYLSQGQYNEAITDFDEAIQLLPDFDEAYYWRGRAKHSLDQYDEAITDYDEAIRLYPNNLQTYRCRAKAKIKIEELRSAQQDFEMALTLAEKGGDIQLIREIKNDISEVEKSLQALYDDIPF